MAGAYRFASFASEETSLTASILLGLRGNFCVQKLGFFSQLSTTSAPLTSLCHGLSGVCQGFVHGSKLTKPLILLICHSVMGPEGGGGGVGAGKDRKCTTFWQQPPLRPMVLFSCFAQIFTNFHL